ncbi:AfsR/SARP family transcriptional regulator [Amycolatopsis circi]|uniref:AfsR/SARP family transcriptional regulator n=1 Tax=Amycolatopsis circi TaxID=871959 RepID=UPI0013BE9D1C|nr:AfsR/SARP family transcriptional regulator [Amycolatopsis circi]
MALQFRLLGPLSVLSDDRDITPSAPKLREILALLIVRANQRVSMNDLVDELWGARPPRSAQVTVQTYIHRLRKNMFPNETGEPAAALHTTWQGYRLEIASDAVDKWQFENMMQRGSTALENGAPDQATELLSYALRLWRGPAMGDVETGELLTAYAARLEESRLRALEGRIEADLQLNRHRDLVSELKELTITHPLHESFHSQLMLALYRCQRRDVALDVFRRFRGRLVEELAVEPSQYMQRLHQSMLAGEAEGRLAPEPRTERITIAAPAQLPNDIADFVGRAEQISSAAHWLCPGQREDEALRVVAVNGMPGVGKSAFATRLAQRLRPVFGDGQLYATLGASEDTPRQPSEVLGQLLRAAGFVDAQIPDSTEERATMFRSWCVDRRVLVVLDDAASDAQVQPLLPAGAGCAVIVTARCGLQAMPGAHAVDLEPLSDSEGLELLGGMAGHERAAAEPDEVRRIASMCGNLPLALRCLGARLRSAPRWPVRNLRRHFEGSSRPLDMLRFSGLDVRARLKSCLRTVPAPARGVFRLLPSLGRDQFTAADVAAKLDCSPKFAEAILARLVGHGLLHIEPASRAPADYDEPVSFEFHPLTRWFAEELLGAGNGPLPYLWPLHLRYSGRNSFPR